MSDTEKGKAWKKRVSNKKYDEGWERIFGKNKAHSEDCKLMKQAHNHECLAHNGPLTAKCTCGFDKENQ